jgi:PTH1 family peptidyl-tRNA hydrolase
VKAVLGLGNPGRKYARTRHNLGFAVVDRIAAEHRVAITTKKCLSLIGEWQTGAERILLAKPQTYMNLTGAAVREILHYFPVTSGDLVVICDDLDLPLGRIRIRPRGGVGGHRGLQSILEMVGDKNFLRVRIGIGRPPAGVEPTDYVLQRFTEEEAGIFDEAVERAAEAVDCLLTEGTLRAMEKFNRAEKGRIREL